MEGAALRQEREYNLAITQAWHTAIFALNGYAGGLKNKSLADYLVGQQKAEAKRSTLSSAISFFHSMRAAGMPVEITRVPRESANG